MAKQQARLIDVPHYHYLQALYMSFYSSRLYVDVAKRWPGLGLIYFLLMLSLALLPLTLRIIVDFNHYFDEQIIQPFKDMPPLYIQNGSVSFNKPMPYLIKNKQDSVVAIIDTTGKFKTINNTYPELTILVTKHTLFYRAPKFHLFFMDKPFSMESKIQTNTFENDDNEVFEGDEWIKFSHIISVKWLTLVMIYPLIVLFIYGLFFTFMLGFSLLAQVFSHVILKFDLRYITTCRVLFVSSTPLFFILFILLSANFLMVGKGLIYCAILSAYFSFAVLSIRRASNKLVLL